MRGMDLTGRRFGKLTVLKVDEEFEAIRGSKPRRWICQCDCGTIKSIRGIELTRTKKSQKSCGCEAHKRAKNFGQITFKDLTGQKFGLLTAVEKVGKNQYGYAMWKCICDCGKECVVASRELNSGDTIFCGCQKNSFREYQIEQWLKNNKISYQKEYTFDDLKDTFKLRFDFAIFDNVNNLICLIEHQGIQHTNASEWHTKLSDKHDQMKKDYCREKNISLYEIWYYDDIEEKLKEILLKEE